MQSIGDSGVTKRGVQALETTLMSDLSTRQADGAVATQKGSAQHTPGRCCGVNAKGVCAAHAKQMVR